MKESGAMAGGGPVKWEYVPIWAKYMARYVTEMRKEGIPIFMLTVQNEPAAAMGWESCNYSGEEEGVFAVEYLKPALRDAGLEDVKVFIWDHNKGACLERAHQSFSQPGAEVIDGLAFHWYAGDHFEDVVATHEAYPKKLLFSTEICRDCDVWGAEGLLLFVVVIVNISCCYYLFLLLFVIVIIIYYCYYYLLLLLLLLLILVVIIICYCYYYYSYYYCY
jgi:O-glycosyl hydrolase